MWVLELNDAEITLSRTARSYREPASPPSPPHAAFGNADARHTRPSTRGARRTSTSPHERPEPSRHGPGVATQATWSIATCATDSRARWARRRRCPSSSRGASTPGAARHCLLACPEAGPAGGAAPARAAVAPAGCMAALPPESQVARHRLHRAFDRDARMRVDGYADRRRGSCRSGLAAPLEGWVGRVADRFSSPKNPVDPLSIAAAEQQVFDQVHPPWRPARQS